MINSKVIFENTYGYENFITDEERNEIETWAFLEQERMRKVYPINNESDQRKKDIIRHFGKLSELTHVPKLVNELKEKLIEYEQLEEFLPEPHNGDWISIVGQDAYVEPHIDANLNRNYYTRRYNLLISLPTSGGLPIYDGKIIPVKEKLIWRCDAGLYNHTSEIVNGNRFRINLSFGFSISIDWENKKFNKKVIKSLI